VFHAATGRGHGEGRVESQQQVLRRLWQRARRSGTRSRDEVPWRRLHLRYLAVNWRYMAINWRYMAVCTQYLAVNCHSESLLFMEADRTTHYLLCRLSLKELILC